MTFYTERRKRLLDAASEFDNIVVENPKNLFYLTDFWGGGIAVVNRDATILITPVMEEDRARRTANEVEVRTGSTKQDMREQLLRIISTSRRENTLIDQGDELFDDFVAHPGRFTSVRRKKDALEVERIQEASKRIDSIYAQLVESVKVGMTEREVAAMVMDRATLEGLSPLAAEGSLDAVIIAAGENGAFPHSDLSDRALKEGDMLIADIFFRYKGYCSDCTRTFAVGRADKEKRTAYNAVLEAQLKGIELVEVGASGRSVHEGVKRELEKSNLAQYFTHGTGHGVGIDVHEEPSLGARSVSILESGDVVTVEPGVYLPGKYGVRVEDTLVVREGRPIVLFKCPKDELIVLG